MGSHHLVPAIVLYCNVCGLIRVADDSNAAHARATAHAQLSGHDAIEYSTVEDPDRLRIARAFERRSARTVSGYVEDRLQGSPEGLGSEDVLVDAVIRDITVGR